MKYYRDKFGFEITSQRESYDSDDSDDESDGQIYYRMRLDLSKVSGGKMKKRYRKNTKRNTKRKRIISTRKRRKLRK